MANGDQSKTLWERMRTGGQGWNYAPPIQPGGALAGMQRLDPKIAQIMQGFGGPQPPPTRSPGGFHWKYGDPHEGGATAGMKQFGSDVAQAFGGFGPAQTTPKPPPQAAPQPSPQAGGSAPEHAQPGETTERSWAEGPQSEGGGWMPAAARGIGYLLGAATNPNEETYISPITGQRGPMPTTTPEGQQWYDRQIGTLRGAQPGVQTVQGGNRGQAVPGAGPTQGGATPGAATDPIEAFLRREAEGAINPFPHSTVGTVITQPMQAGRDYAIDRYLAYQGHRAGLAKHQQDIETASAQAEGMRGEAEWRRAQAGNLGNVPTAEQMPRALQLAYGKRGEQEPSIADQLIRNPDAEIGSVSRALANEGIKEGTDEWVKKMQGALALRGQTPEEVIKASQPSGFEWGLGHAMPGEAPQHGFRFRTQATPTEAENVRVMNVLQQMLQRSTGPFQGTQQ